jgi:hypothetical protein
LVIARLSGGLASAEVIPDDQHVSDLVVGRATRPRPLPAQTRWPLYIAVVYPYGARSQTAYEHAWEIRDVYGYRDFATGEEELRAFLAARVWSSLAAASFDRAVVWLVNNRVLLPGITTLARMVAAVRYPVSCA